MNTKRVQFMKKDLFLDMISCFLLHHERKPFIITQFMFYVYSEYRHKTLLDFEDFEDLEIFKEIDTDSTRW
jgi:hypothetical protein